MSTSGARPSSGAGASSGHVIAPSLVFARAPPAAVGSVAARRTRSVTERALISRHARAGARHVITGVRVNGALTGQLTAGTVRAIRTLCTSTHACWELIAIKRN